MLKVVAVKATRKPIILGEYMHVDDAQYHAERAADDYKVMKTNNMVVPGISFQVVTGDISDIPIGGIPADQVIFQINGF